MAMAPATTTERVEQRIMENLERPLPLSENMQDIRARHYGYGNLRIINYLLTFHRCLLIKTYCISYEIQTTNRSLCARTAHPYSGCSLAPALANRAMKTTLSVILFAIGLSGVVPVIAHHSFAAEYDANKPVELRGVVTRIEWTNPHAH